MFNDSKRIQSMPNVPVGTLMLTLSDYGVVYGFIAEFSLKPYTNVAA